MKNHQIMPVQAEKKLRFPSALVVTEGGTLTPLAATVP